MIDEEQKKIIDALEKEIKCSKKFQCVSSSFQNLCKAKYYALADLLECLEKESENCIFLKHISPLKTCSCPLRKYIALNIENWIEE